MKKILSCLFGLIFSMMAGAEEAPYLEAAMLWLKLIDAGDYAQSWEEADPYFQSELTSEMWIQALQQVRAPLGAVLSRNTKELVERQNLPGAPEGDYVVIILETSFGEMAAAIETLTLRKTSNTWQAVGYFIR